ncbi:MAG: HlyC/CorC family transporter [Anaerolineaceae bacterium]|nr:HlyC/CorC family transporter [Anaerolineaceae bacterium]
MQEIEQMWIILLLILANGVFAMSEIAIVTARKARLRAQANRGSSRAASALRLAENPDDFLSTIQIGITLITILAGVFGEAAVTSQIEPYFRELPYVGEHSQAISQALVVIVITYLTLVLGELVPKQIGLTHAERVATLVAQPMRFLARLTAPLVSLLSLSTRALLKVLPLRPSREPAVTAEEVQILMEQGRESGVFEPINEEMVEQVFRLRERRVNDLMTPRPDVVYLDLEDSMEKNRQLIIENRHSRYPIMKGDEDNVVGFVLARDLLAQALSDDPLDLKSLMRPVLIVPEGLPVLEVLKRFKDDQSQLAIIIDEYGELQGLMTFNDLLEEIVGDVPEVGDPPDPQAVPREDGSWLIDGMFAVDDLKEMFDIRMLPEEESNYYQTIGGLIMIHLGRVPQAGDYFEWEQYRFEVVDMDWRRVDKVLLTPLDQKERSELADE